MNISKFVLTLLLIVLGIVRADAQVVIGQVHGIHSDVLKEDRKFRVYLPDSYAWATERRYPVLYVLDGESQFLHTATSVDYLAAHGEIPEHIVVGIDSTVRVRDYSPTDWPEAWIGGGGAVNFKSFLSTEFIPTVDRTYRTNKFQVLTGASAGGLFALYCLISEPSLFQGYIALSPSLDWDHNWPQRSLEKAFESTSKLKAFLYIARSDDTGKPLADYERFVLTLQAKAPSGFRYCSKEFPDETHSGVPLLASIDAIRQLYKGYRFHDDMLNKGLPYAEQHFKNVSNTVGLPLTIPESVINDFGYVALSEGKNQEAIDLFKRNVEANPNSSNAFDSLADGYAKSKLWKEAVQASEKAVALATQFSNPSSSLFIEKYKKLQERLNQSSDNLK